MAAILGILLTITAGELPAQTPGRLANLSARAMAGREADALTAGFVIAGPGAKRVLVRAAGPALVAMGVTGALAEARLELYQGPTLIASNAGWDSGLDADAVAAAARAAGAFAFPARSADSALLVSLQPGNYTARVVPARPTTAVGVALAEVYDADPAAPARLLNLSARARSGPGTETLIAGFVVAGEQRNRLLVRAAGPALTVFGVPDALTDPQLEIFRGNTGVAFNDNWESNTNPAQVGAVARASGAFAFGSGTRDAALLVPAGQGDYTAAVTSATDASGVALVEVYDTAAVRGDIPARAFDLVGFARVPGHGMTGLTGGGAPTETYDPVTQSGNFWRIDDATVAVPAFPAQFQAALTSSRPLVIELETMLDLSRVAAPSNGPTAIAHPDLFLPGRTNGVIGLLSLGSNKTIYSAFGLGGFRRGTLRIDGTRNVILRNLKFRELWEWDDATAGQYDRNDWDYLTILSRFSGADVTSRTHHIWIDHCDFEKSYDGLFDIVQGTDLVTVSWCKIAGVMSGETERWVERQFDYLEANLLRFPHYRTQRSLYERTALRRREVFQMKANLVGNATDPITAAHDLGHLNVTFHHNWYVNVDQRMPRMRYGNAHVFNLVADSSSGADIIGLSRMAVAATSGAAVRLENAWFTGVRAPLTVRVGAEPLGSILALNSISRDPTTGAVDIVPSSLFAEPFAWNAPAPATGIVGWPLADSAVMPAGYTAPGVRLSDYLDAADYLPAHLSWVGVIVPADAAEAQTWRVRWQRVGP